MKQKVQAFEKHAVQGATPERFKSSASKYASINLIMVSQSHTFLLQSTLKAGTPSKIALYSKTTPLSVNKTSKLLSSASGSGLTASAPGFKAQKASKKMHSLSQESLDDIVKHRQQQSDLNRQLEEKRKVREEKQRQAQLQREAIEKEKRDQAVKLQLEREEKYRKIMKEKEEKQRVEALKKKTLKDKQAKKFAEEKAKKDEFVVPKPLAENQSSNKDDSLLLKLQKQKLIDKAAQEKKDASKNHYDFDMLHTDDSTDDESRPSQKRPPPPTWSRSKNEMLNDIVPHLFYIVYF